MCHNRKGEPLSPEAGACRLLREKRGVCRFESNYDVCLFLGGRMSSIEEYPSIVIR